MAKSHWIIKRSEDESLIASAVKRKGKIFHCSGVQSLHDAGNLAGTISLTIDSSKASVLIEEFPDVKDDVLQLQIENKINQLALFNVEENISTAYSVINERRQKRLLSIIAQPEYLTTEGIQTVSVSGRVQLENCVSTVAATACLLQQLGPDPFIVLLITRLSALLIGVRDGVPLFLQSIPLSGPAEVDSGVASHAIGFGRQTLQRDFEIDSCRLVCLGEGRDSFDFEALDEENWIPDWSHFLSAEGNDIVLYPGLFGALFVGSRFSFLPVGYKWEG
ncbi:MAG: hypothetical protein V2I36_11575 [Desulfopila sp.]|jgi:hypothetical protein|nr:hypothetical protein [Desulfopila sp.]